MRIMLIIALTAIIMSMTSEVSGHRNHSGRGGGRRFNCLVSVCDDAADASTCRTCLRDLKSSGNAPRQAIKDCFKTNKGCEDAAAFRTCLSDANADVTLFKRPLISSLKS
ncbi:uncharacterized protein [Palaemon carinicauda]|uniref:uncharacterized protein n=1 Tax=Palaemon carinicauda TaxID=392227 RepID=UPI0035B6AA1C